MGLQAGPQLDVVLGVAVLEAVQVVVQQVEVQQVEVQQVAVQQVAVQQVADLVQAVALLRLVDPPVLALEFAGEFHPLVSISSALGLLVVGADQVAMRYLAAIPVQVAEGGDPAVVQCPSQLSTAV